MGALERDYNLLLQASAHLHTSSHSHLYGFASIIPRLPASEHKQCNREDGESNFSHISGIKDWKMLITHGYALGFRTAKRAKVLGNLLTYLASGGQQPYIKH